MNLLRRLPARRALALATSVALALALSGCVYLRLLQLKRQLGDFDRHFTLITSAGLRLNCLTPVLLSEDLRWLGFEPATTRRIGVAEQWHVRWVKELPPGVVEKTNYEIAFDLFFAEGRLTALSIPENYFGALPKELVVAGIKSLAGAKVDKSSRSVEGQVAPTLPATASWPTRATILAVLGVPTEEIAESGRRLLRYRCISADPGHKGGEFDLRFGFDAANEKLIHVHGRIPAGRIRLNFSPPTDAAVAPVP